MRGENIFLCPISGGQLMPLDTTGSIATRFRAFADTLTRSGFLEAFRCDACADEPGSVFILAALGTAQNCCWWRHQGAGFVSDAGNTHLPEIGRAGGSGQPGGHGGPFFITGWHYYCRFSLESFPTSLTVSSLTPSVIEPLKRQALILRLEPWSLNNPVVYTKTMAEGAGTAGRFDPNFTQNVINAMGPKTSPRLRQVMTSLIKHVHDFARETELTVDEWMAGVQLINWAGQMSTDRRNEGQLVCDVIGLESYVPPAPFTHPLRPPDRSGKRVP
jgi:hypothetical protein